MSNYGGGSDDEERKAELPKCTLTWKTRRGVLPLALQLSSKFSSRASSQNVALWCRTEGNEGEGEQKRKMWEGDGMSVRAVLEAELN